MTMVIFKQDYEHDFRPLAGQCRLYRASEKPQSVPRPVAEAAIAAGRAQYPAKPKKGGKSKDADD